MPGSTRTRVAPLITACILAPAASADIVYEHSNAYVRADDEQGDYADDFFGGAGPFSITAADGPQEATVVAEPMSLRLDTYSGGDGVAFAVDVVSYFSVSGDTGMTVRWSFDANTRYESGRIILTNDDTNATLLDVDFGSNGPGNVQVLLDAGTRYRVTANIASTDGAGTSFAHFIIPTPGTAALFGAGLVLLPSRRRH